jgi:hypothetical protein
MLQHKDPEVWQIVKYNYDFFPAVIGRVFDYGELPVKEYTLIIKKPDGSFKAITYLYWCREWGLEFEW